MVDPKEIGNMLFRAWSGQENIECPEQIREAIAKNLVYAPLLKGESGVISWQAPKTAALCFDRVWTGKETHVPEGIRFFNGTQEEVFVTLSTLGVAASLALETPEQREAAERAHAGGFAALKGFFDFMTSVGGALRQRFHSPDDAFGSMNRILSEELSVPSLYTQNRNQIPYSPGDHETILSTLTDLKIVDENAITWEQVTEFRRDEEARKKYRRLVHWLDKEMVGQSPSFIRDEIAIRLERYDWALRKHGILTVSGALSSMLKAEQLLTAAASGVFVSKFAGGPFAGLCVASGTLIASTAIEIVKSRLELADTKIDAEIAFVHDAKSLSGTYS